MDLDMIQDLLGGSNLPPPPSVQDLLGDVVPITRSPSPPPAPLPSVRLSAEHNYSKAPVDGAADVAEPMDSSSAASPGSETLFSLNSTVDCYEAFLLTLLRVYTQNRIDSESTAAGGSASDHSNNTAGSLFTIDSISPDAISALSPEQVQSLVTSNSMNYDVVHQILAYRQKMEGREGGSGGDSGGDSAVGEKGEVGEVGEGRQGEGDGALTDEATSALRQLQALQLTPEQLKQIQEQMAELIRTKQIILPTELSLEQQQQLLQSLILKQVHMQYQQPAATTPTQPSPTASSPTVTKSTGSSTKSPPGRGMLAAMLRKDIEKSENQERRGGGGAKAIKIEVPPPSNLSAQSRDSNTIPLQLSPNPVGDAGSQTSVPNETAVQPLATRSGGGRRKKDAKDEDEPKKPSSPYGIFFSDVYPSILQANPRMSFSEASKLISAMWNAMGGDTKKQYHDRCERQKETYQAFLASRKTPSLDPPPQQTQTLETKSVDTQTMAQAAPTLPRQTVRVEVLATQPAPGLTDALTSKETQISPPPPPPPSTQPRVVIKDIKHCINDGCYKDAVYTEFRGPRYCSNECVVQHCRSVFQEWVAQRKVAT